MLRVVVGWELGNGALCKMKDVLARRSITGKTNVARFHMIRDR